MERYYGESEIVKAIDKHMIDGDGFAYLDDDITCILEDTPLADVVSREYADQIKWERDTAIQQLKELGYSLGEKIRTGEDTISRQMAIDAIKEVFNPNITKFVRAKLAIENLPSTQPEIIRCGECVKREHCRTTNTWAVAPSDDWFCADAERRTD